MLGLHEQKNAKSEQLPMISATTRLRRVVAQWI